MKTEKNCSCALISCNRSKSRTAAKNRSNFAVEEKNSRGRNLSIERRTSGKRHVETYCSDWIWAIRLGLNYKNLAGAVERQYSSWITDVRGECARYAPAHRNVRKTSLVFYLISRDCFL